MTQRTHDNADARLIRFFASRSADRDVRMYWLRDFVLSEAGDDVVTYDHVVTYDDCIAEHDAAVRRSLASKTYCPREVK